MTKYGHFNTRKQNLLFSNLIPFSWYVTCLLAPFNYHVSTQKIVISHQVDPWEFYTVFISSFRNFRNCYLESDVDCVLFAVKTMIRSLSNKEIGLYAKRDNYFAEKSDG